MFPSLRYIIPRLGYLSALLQKRCRSRDKLEADRKHAREKEREQWTCQSEKRLREARERRRMSIDTIEEEQRRRVRNNTILFHIYVRCLQNSLSMANMTRRIIGQEGAYLPLVGVFVRLMQQYE